MHHVETNMTPSCYQSRVTRPHEAEIYQCLRFIVVLGIHECIVGRTMPAADMNTAYSGMSQQCADLRMLPVHTVTVQTPWSAHRVLPPGRLNPKPDPHLPGPAAARRLLGRSRTIVDKRSHPPTSPKAQRSESHARRSRFRLRPHG